MGLGMDIRWETVPCLSCGSRRWEVLVTADDPLAPESPLRMTVVKCRDCHLSFTNPRPTPESIGRFYPADYGPHQSAPLDALPGVAGRRIHGRYARTGLPGRPRPGRDRLLDFGCGAGGFLRNMHAIGWKVTGVDASATAVDRIRAELELPALLGTLPHPDLPAEGFHVITMWQSLEHVPDPLGVLREAHRLLAAGGTLVVAVPNIESLPFRLFGRDWYGLDLPRHLVHFSPRTLASMVEKARFRVSMIRGQRHRCWLQSSAQLASRRQRGYRRLGWLTWRPLASLVARYSLLTGQSDGLLLVATKES